MPPPTTPPPSGGDEIASGRLALGCLCCSLGFAAALIARNFARNTDALALALVAMIGGTVLGGWGLYATFASERVSSKGLWLAALLMLPALLAAGGNLAVNGEAFGLPFVEVELLIAGFCLLAAFVIAFSWSRFPGQQRKAPHVRRGRALIVFAAVALLLWGLLRYPALAWYHIGQSAGTRNPDWPKHRTELLNMPDFVRRRAVNWVFNSGDYDYRQTALDVCRYKPGISADDLAEFCLHGRPGLRHEAMRALQCADRERTVAVSRQLLQMPDVRYPLPWDWLYAWMDFGTPEDFDLLLRSKCRLFAMRAAVYKRRGDLVLYSMKNPKGRVALNEWRSASSERFIINGAHSAFRAEFYNALSPDELPHIRLEATRVRLEIRGGKDVIEDSLNMFLAGIGDPDISVVRAAYKKFLSCVENADDLRALFAPLREDRDEQLCAIALKLKTLIEYANVQVK